MDFCETLGEDMRGFMRLWERIHETLGYFGRGFARIHETLGEDLLRFMRLWDRIWEDL